MAYVINPDGTNIAVEADYDRNGNLKPPNKRVTRCQARCYKRMDAPSAYVRKLEENQKRRLSSATP